MTNYDLQKAQEHFQARVAFTTGVHELEVLTQQAQGDFVVVDVRYPSDYAKGHVPGAINLPKGKWQNPKPDKPEPNRAIAVPLRFEQWHRRGGCYGTSDDAVLAESGGRAVVL